MALAIWRFWLDGWVTPITSEDVFEFLDSEERDRLLGFKEGLLVGSGTNAGVTERLTVGRAMMSPGGGRMLMPRSQRTDD